MKKLATIGPCHRHGRGPRRWRDLVIPDLHYRTGPFAAGGIPFSDGYQDYFTLLNQRDGGIGGVPICGSSAARPAYNTRARRGVLRIDQG